MNCDTLQTHLLGLATPDRPTHPEARQHLVQCATCREWHRQLVRMERAIALVPVPSGSLGRDRLLDLLRTGKGSERPSAPATAGTTSPPERPSIAMVLGSLILDPHASPRRRVGAGLVAGVAAALVLFVTGFLLWYGTRQESPLVVNRPTKKVPQVDPLVAELMRRNLKLAEGATPQDRVEAMAGVAQQLHDRSRKLAPQAAADDMAVLANLYDRVVREGILTRAKDVPAEARPNILEPIRQQLEKAESEARRMSQDELLPRSSREAFEQIALAAQHGDQSLRKLVAEGRS